MEPAITQLIEAVIALILAIVAYLKYREAGAVTAKLENVVIAYTEPNAPEPVIEELPARSWKMDQGTKQFLTAGAFKPYTAYILEAVEKAEAARLTDYWINVPNGVGYHITWGLLKEQVGNT
jgi:hypothetical protein